MDLKKSERKRNRSRLIKSYRDFKRFSVSQRDSLTGFSKCFVFFFFCYSSTIFFMALKSNWNQHVNCVVSLFRGFCLLVVLCWACMLKVQREDICSYKTSILTASRGTNNGRNFQFWNENPTLVMLVDSLSVLVMDGWWTRCHMTTRWWNVSHLYSASPSWYLCGFTHIGTSCAAAPWSTSALSSTRSPLPEISIIDSHSSWFEDGSGPDGLSSVSLLPCANPFVTEWQKQCW